MKELKIYFKSKEFLISTALILVLLILGIIQFYKTSYYNGELFYKEINRFGFWNDIFKEDYGSFLMFISPFIISILSISLFYKKVSTSYLKVTLLKLQYKKFIIKELFLSYVKAYIPFLIGSMLLFIFGCCFLRSDIVIPEYALKYVDFYNTSQPYIFFIVHQLLLFLYVIMIVNISYIAVYLTKRIDVSIILTFLLLNIYNFIIVSIANFIYPLFDKYQNISESIKFLNVYEAYTIESTMTNAFINTSIHIILFSIIIVILYSNKEKVVRHFE